jgi:hypothetical protein
LINKVAVIKSCRPPDEPEYGKKIKLEKKVVIFEEK